MSASITVTPPYACNQGSPMQGNWGKAKALARKKRKGETGHLRHYDLWGPFEECEAMAWAMKDGESDALIQLLA